jgi:Domain of unknown function (DUF222)
MPAKAATARASLQPSPASPPSPADGLREALLARVRTATASALASQDAEWDAEIAAVEAAGDDEVPTEEELAGLAPDPLAGPPDGEYAWLADLPGPLLNEYLAATAEPARPEPIAAGLWNRTAGDGAGFAAGGMADDLPPGPVLAGLTGDVHAAGLGRLTDDELIGVLRAARRLGSWSASLELSAVGDLMCRRVDQEAAGQSGAAGHADAEIAAALTLTGRAAGGLLDLAVAMARLPQTARALAAGVIDLPRAMVIVDEVAGLGDEHIAALEDQVLTRAGGQTTTMLRRATRRAVIAADPLAARKRRQQAEREARVERWTEQSGTAALAGRDLPPAGALAADQHLSELASALRAAGLAGTMDQLRAQVFVALLTGQPVTSLLPPGGMSSADGAAGAGPPGGAGFPDSATPGGPGSVSSSGSKSAAGRGSGNGLAVAGMVNLTMPLGTWLGLSQSPGEVPGFGPLGAEDSRSLGLVMAAHPRTRWCLTVTDYNGRPVAHGCVPPRRGPPPCDPGPPPARPGTPDGGASPPVSAGWGGSDGIAAWAAGVQLQWLESGACVHRRESAGYRPPPSLQHLIRVRQQLCLFPGCGRAARRCDLDHTIPYHLGGRTCECNLAPLCRKHHQAKQTQGWKLDQPEPGIMIWTTPGERRYTTRATTYPC